MWEGCAHAHDEDEQGDGAPNDTDEEGSSGIVADWLAAHCICNVLGFCVKEERQSFTFTMRDEMAEVLT